jgi:hypothetical protein
MDPRCTRATVAEGGVLADAATDAPVLHPEIDTAIPAAKTMPATGITKIRFRMFPSADCLKRKISGLRFACENAKRSAWPWRLRHRARPDREVWSRSTLAWVSQGDLAAFY